MRVYGLDVIRIISFWVISCYHFTYTVWLDRAEQYDVVMSAEPIFYNYVRPFCHALSFGGFTIMLLTTFLIGFRNSAAKIHWRLFAFILAAWVLFSWADEEFIKITLYWEVYPLLVLGLLIIEALHKKGHGLVYLLGAAGFVMTFFSFYDQNFALPLWAEQSLFGNCAENLANWPIFPWLGFVFFGYAIGVAANQYRGILDRISRVELTVWIATLFGSCFFLGAFYQLHPISEFECFAFRVPPVKFWAHLIFIVFLMRISLVTQVNDYIGTHLGRVTQFQTSRNFFLVYALQYILCFALAVTAGESLRANPSVFTLVMLLTLPITELLVWLISLSGINRLIRR